MILALCGYSSFFKMGLFSNKNSWKSVSLPRKSPL